MMMLAPLVTGRQQVQKPLSLLKKNWAPVLAQKTLEKFIFANQLQVYSTIIDLWWLL